VAKLRSPDVSTEEINLSPDEWKILSLITGERSIREIAHLAKFTEFNAAKVFYGLISSGLVKLKKPQKKEDEKKAEEKKEKKEVKKKRGLFRRG